MDYQFKDSLSAFFIFGLFAVCISVPVGDVVFNTIGAIGAIYLVFPITVIAYLGFDVFYHYASFKEEQQRKERQRDHDGGSATRRPWRRD